MPSCSEQSETLEDVLSVTTTLTTMHNFSRKLRSSLGNLSLSFTAFCAVLLASPGYALDLGPSKINVGGSENSASQAGGSSGQAQDDITDPGVLAVSSMNPPRIWPTSPHCRPNSFTVSTDVDTAYARVMRKFTFRTTEEVREMEKRTTVYRTDPIYKHTAKPGSFYRMEQLVQYGGENGETKTLHLSMTLSKEKKGTFVEANYCTNPRNAQEATAAYHAFVNKTIRNTFK